MANIFPIDFEEKLTMAQDDYILFSDSEDGNKIKKAQYKNLKGEKWDTWATWPQWEQGIQWPQWEQWIQWPQGIQWETWPQWETGATWPTWPQWPTWATGNWISSITSSKVWKTTTVTIIETNGIVDTFQVQDWADWQWSGDVIWPASSTDGDVAIFDWTTWKLIKDGSVALSTLSAWASAWATAVQPWDIGTAAACNTWTSSWNVPILDSNWKLATSTLPWVALTDTFTVSTSSDLTSLSSADQWDIAIVTTENKTYVLSQAPYSTAANWKQILSPTWWVTSWNGQTWAVTYTAPVTSVNGSTWAVTVQATLVSGTNIKTVNWNSILGSGNLTISWLPAWWTNGQIIMMVNGVATWVNPADVWFRLQASDTEIDVPYVWSGTEAQYTARQSYSDDTEYHTV